MPSKWSSNASSNSVSEWLPAVRREFLETTVQHSLRPRISIRFHSRQICQMTHLNSWASLPQTLGSVCKASRMTMTNCPLRMRYLPPMISSLSLGVTLKPGAVALSLSASLSAASTYSSFCNCSNSMGLSPHILSTSSRTAW